MRQIVLLLSSLFLAGSVFAGPVLANSILSLSSALNERMLIMKDVAGYKAEHHLPVEDLVREQKVVSLAQEEAKDTGLDPHSVVPFIQAQMDVAKAIQYRYLADWLSSPEQNWRPKHLDDVRKTISDQDRVILSSISQRLRAGSFSEKDKLEISSLLNAPNLSDTDKSHLVNALLLIKHRT
ncbi:chorismate mutase [Sodalis sp. dw_96]|uniref:chorismate mutase n=1 Tax=Sodalis sp. dw_96 TaxID=2719794 RepID=UPI001BD62C92|nr:chorismate mutase [Sodalis sp. dw_96]